MKSNRDALRDSVEIALASLHQDRKPLLLASWNGLLYYVLADDWPALNLPKDRLFKTLKDARSAEAWRKVPPPGSCIDFTGPGFDLIRRLLTRYPEAMLLDVGANYGREGIRYAMYRRELGLPVSDERPAVLAFEPGPIRHLAAVNIDLHQTPEVRLLPYAAGAENSYTQFCISDAHSLGGSMAIGPHADWKALTVKTTRLDTILNEFCCDTPIFLKVDTQGAEEMIISGMSDYLSEHAIVGIFEFAPTLMERIGDTRAFLSRLLEIGAVYDLGMKHDRRDQLTYDEIATLIEKVKAEKIRCTDLLVIDHRLKI